ncbi:RNA polymerase sigma factor [Demequina muriae]|uniref:Sigma-70 family RNA polymerase sigma factor n=1 Tax=Demequina muriae TaxID=3051664 RepID=A0ABT8GGR7_9MICO|nr:sigma-70 family RNA polymerase sigma factor [Demequina sp. EGI L300058]MDN4480623.1 sigma-70 family RNA polymerase sigma factor [Demequina sp. EGI L300058]
MQRWEPMLDELMAQRHRHLVAYARMLTGDTAHAEDLVQDALITTFGRMRTFPSLVAAETYTRRVIASRFIDGKRRRAAERRAVQKVGSHEADPSAGPDLLVEHRTDVERALDLLTPRERACVVLRFLEHYSVEETAAELGIAAGSVKRYVHDGIGKLNAALGTNSDADAPVSSSVHVGTRSA